MNLIIDLKEHINNKNAMLIKKLTDIIVSNNINTIDELKNFEDKKFTLDEKVLTTEERIDYCVEILRSFPYDYDCLDYDQIQEYKYFRKTLETSDSNEQKIKALILLFDLTSRTLFFVYEAYNLIINNEI